MDNGTVFEINGEKYNVIKRGLSQAKQVADATRWLAKYGAPAFRKLADNNFESMGGVEIAIAVLSSLDEYALVELFQIVFGCSREIAEQDFDLVLMIDGLVAVYNQSPTIRKLADRFFSQASSESIEASNSMPSEALTAG